MVTQEEIDKMSPEEIAELQKQNCPFCKIVAGEIPSSKVFEDSDVLGILDINPAKKGHVLLLPKQHVPIMPIIPPPVFKKLFSTAKVLSKSIKKAMLVPYTTLFIANGAVAGQQAAHFLFHVIPREKGDGLSNFDIKPNDDFLKDQESLFSSLKNNLTMMMRNHAKREGKSYEKKSSSSGPSSSAASSSAASSSAASSSAASSSNTSLSPSSFSSQENISPEQSKDLVDKRREQLAMILESNPAVKDLLISNPEEFKKQLAITPQLQPLFEGVDIDALSKGLQKLNPSLNNGSSSENGKENSQEPALESSQKDASQENISQEEPTPIQQRKPEVFLGENPLAQKEKVFAYFEKKSKAKELLMNDLAKFKELLAGREDVQEIFKDVNLDKLSEKLIEAKEYEKERIKQSNLPDENLSLEDSLGGNSDE